jgi:hypothetical protein
VASDGSTESADNRADARRSETDETDDICSLTLATGGEIFDCIGARRDALRSETDTSLLQRRVEKLNFGFDEARPELAPMLGPFSLRLLSTESCP